MRRPFALMLIALPASLSAQIAPRATGDYELQRSRDAIRAGRKSGSLTKSEVRGLRREADANDALADRYPRDGLSQSERRELDMRGMALQSLTGAQRAQPRRP